MILADEIYSRNIYGPSSPRSRSSTGMRERTIVVDGFSKAYAMTGWRLGYASRPAKVAPRSRSSANNTYSCTATFVQKRRRRRAHGPDEAVQR